MREKELLREAMKGIPPEHLEAAMADFYARQPGVWMGPPPPSIDAQIAHMDAVMRARGLDSSVGRRKQ